MKEIYITVNIKTINREMVISISGAQCTGKTTLINALKETEPFKENTVFMGSPSRKGNDKGVKINQSAGLIDQLWITSSYIKELVEVVMSHPKHVISDRCILDMLCYTDYHCYHSDGLERNRWSEMRDTVTQLMFHVEGLYDYHIILKPEFEIVDDGVRSIDPVYQRDINNLFEANMNMLMDFVPEKIIHVTGSVEERVKFILSLIK